MKKYQISIKGKQFEIIQDDDGKFITPDYIKEQEQFGTTLKPAYEPIIVARKPFKGSLVDNVVKYDVGGINIDECRVGEETISTHNAPKGTFAGGEAGRGSDTNSYKNHVGRFPANVIHDGSEEVIKYMPRTKGTNPQELGDKGFWFGENRSNKPMSRGYDDEDSASRYFYCAKASKKDRDEGLECLESKVRFQQGNYSQSPVCSVCGKTFNGTNDHSQCGEHTMIYISKPENTIVKNTHPTVKPTALMQYLIRLVTPKGGTILDPFAGSGSTGKAAMYENIERNKNYQFIGIEITDEYLPIAKARIENVKVEKPKFKQLSLFEEGEDNDE